MPPPAGVSNTTWWRGSTSPLRARAHTKEEARMGEGPCHDAEAGLWSTRGSPSQTAEDGVQWGGPGRHHGVVQRPGCRISSSSSSSSAQRSTAQHSAEHNTEHSTVQQRPKSTYRSMLDGTRPSAFQHSREEHSAPGGRINRWYHAAHALAMRCIYPPPPPKKGQAEVAGLWSIDCAFGQHRFQSSNGC